MSESKKTFDTGRRQTINGCAFPFYLTVERQTVGKLKGRWTVTETCNGVAEGMRVFSSEAQALGHVAAIGGK